MSPKPGTKVTLVPPATPAEAKEAVQAEAGAVTELQHAAGQRQPGQAGSTKLASHHPPETQAGKEEKPSWIEIELLDDAGDPVSGARYRVTLPDGTADEGTLDAKGFARVDGFAPGECKVEFPDFDGREWKPA